MATGSRTWQTGWFRPGHWDLRRRAEGRGGSLGFATGLQRFRRNAGLRQHCGRMLPEFGGNQDPETRARAGKLWEAAVAAEASPAEPHVQLGKPALDLAPPEDAVWRLEPAGKRKPAGSKRHCVLARACRQLGCVREAERETEPFERARATAMDSPGKSPGLPERSEPAKEMR